MLTAPARINASLTANGLALHKKLVETWKRLEATTVAALGAREREEMLRLLGVVENAVLADCKKRHGRAVGP